MSATDSSVRYGFLEIIPSSVVLYACLSYSIYGLALLGIVNKYTILAASAITCCAGFLALKKWGGPLLTTAAGRKRILLLAAIVIAGSLPVIGIPAYMSDDMIYHLLVPKNIAESGKFPCDPANITANFPLLFEMPLTFSEAFKGIIPPFIVNVFFLVCLGGAMYGFGRRHFALSPRMALMASSTILATPVFFNLAHSCYVEIFFTLNIVLAWHYYCTYLDDGKRRVQWRLAMLFMGLACATKYLGLIFLSVLAVYEWFRAAKRSDYYLGLFIAMAVCMPWYVKNWIVTGNPVFPLANDLFRSAFVSPARLTNFKGLLSDYNAGRTPADYLLLPLRLVAGWNPAPQVHRLGFDGQLSVFFITALFGFGWRDEKRRILGLAAIVGALIWMVGSQQVRFFLPVVIPISIAGFSVVARSKFRLRGVVAVFCLAAIGQGAFNTWRSADRDEIIALLKGKINRETFLIHKMPVSFGVASRVNGLLGGTKARVMTVGTFGRNYYFSVPVISNTFYEEEPFDRAFAAGKTDTASLTAFFNRNGITHVLFNLERFNPVACDTAVIDCMEKGRWFFRHFEPCFFGDKAVLCRLK